MAQGKPQLRVAGVPIRFELTFFVIIGLLGYTLAETPALLAAWVVIAAVSIVIHEMGHALAYKAFGHDSHIVLMGFGGVTTGPRLPPARSIIVSLAGPLSGLILLGLPALALTTTDWFPSDEAQLILFFFVWVNLVWAIINLLPVLPLDGGNVTASAIELVSGRDGERPTRILSIVVAGAAALASLAGGYLFGVLFAGFFVAINVNALRQAATPEIRAELGKAQGALIAGRTAEAVALADAVIARRPPRDLLALALEISAWARLFHGDVAGAQIAVDRLPKEVRPPVTLNGALSLRAGRTDEGLSLLAWGFVNDHEEGAKVFASAIAAQAGQVVPLVRELLGLADGAGLEAAWKVQVTLHQLGRYRDAVEVGNALLADGRLPSGEVAFHVARSLALDGRVDEAVDWLGWAVDRGWADPERLADDPDLAAARATAAYAGVRSRALAAARR
jgi:Zn-dependent protease